MRTRIISAFPGVGKTHYYLQHLGSSLDSDSSMFSWREDTDGNTIRNPDFPRNYIEHIKSNIGKFEYIFVSSHKEVRDALLENCLFFYLIYPGMNRREEFLKRYVDRGSPEPFVKLIDKNWGKWITECLFCNLGCKNIVMRSSSYSLTDEIARIHKDEC